MIKIKGVNKESTVSTPSLEAHSAYALADNPELWEPQRQNNFEFVVSDLDNLVRPGVDPESDNASFGNAQKLLRLSVMSSSVPHFTQNVITLNRGNTSMKVAGRIEFPEGSLVIRDAIGADTKSILMAWQMKAGDPQTGKVGLMSDYYKDAWLIEYTPDYQVVRQWRLKGCWISGLTEDAYNMDNDGEKTVTATIQYNMGYIDNSDIL